jgi:hypothetical protein
VQYAILHRQNTAELYLPEVGQAPYEPEMGDVNDQGCATEKPGCWFSFMASQLTPTEASGSSRTPSAACGLPQPNLCGSTTNPGERRSGSPGSVPGTLGEPVVVCDMAGWCFSEGRIPHEGEASYHGWGSVEPSGSSCGESGATIIQARVTRARRFSKVRVFLASSTTAQRCSLCSSERRTVSVVTRPRK